MHQQTHHGRTHLEAPLVDARRAAVVVPVVQVVRLPGLLVLMAGRGSPPGTLGGDGGRLQLRVSEALQGGGLGHALRQGLVLAVAAVG